MQRSWDLWDLGWNQRLMSMWVLVCRAFHPLGVTWPLQAVPVKTCLDVPFRLVKDRGVWMWILTLSDNSFLWCGISVFIKKHSVLMRETAEDFGDNSGVSPQYVFIISFHSCLSQLWANEKMRLTEKQSCGSVINLNVGDIWGPSYDLLHKLVVTWHHSPGFWVSWHHTCQYHLPASELGFQAELPPPRPEATVNTPRIPSLKELRDPLSHIYLILLSFTVSFDLLL